MYFIIRYERAFFKRNGKITRLGGAFFSADLLNYSFLNFFFFYLFFKYAGHDLRQAFLLFFCDLLKLFG